MLHNLPAKVQGFNISMPLREESQLYRKFKSKHKNATVLVWKGCSKLPKQMTWFKLLIRPWIRGFISLWRGKCASQTQYFSVWTEHIESVELSCCFSSRPPPTRFSDWSERRREEFSASPCNHDRGRGKQWYSLCSCLLFSYAMHFSFVMDKLAN